MIEVVYNKEEDAREEKELLFPKNIRQVGTVEGHRKICIEDYAYNFIEDYADGGKTCVGVLLGESRKQKKEQVLFIKGAMDVEQVEISGDEIHFTQEAWNNIYDGIKKYFPESSIVGWYVISNTQSKDKIAKYRKTHSDNFAGSDKTLFIVDRAEETKNFCFYENNRLEKLAGFIIYYEKNENMQNFLVEKRQGTRIEEESQERVKGNFRKLLREVQEDENKTPKRVYISYIANAAMVVMILFVGMYIVNSHQRINELDNSVTELSKELSVSAGEKNTNATVPVVEISGNVYPLPQDGKEVSVETGAVEPTSQESTLSVLESTAIVTEDPTVSDPVSVTPKNYETYEIKKGETLITISKKFYGTTEKIDSIMELNGIEDRDRIYEGQIIKLP